MQTPHHQVAKKSNRPNAAPQPKTNSRKKKAPASRQVADTITCVLTMPDGSEFERVDFPREVFSRIKRTAAKLGITLKQLFDEAIRRHIDSVNAKGGA